jgi:polyadenylate-binding protein
MVNDIEFYNYFVDNGVTNIKCAKLYRASNTYAHTGRGIVAFYPKCEAQAKIALETLNYTKLKGKTLWMSWYNKSFSFPPQSNLFINHIDPAKTPLDLHNLLGQFGHIFSLFCPQKQDGTMKGYGYVQYDTAECAKLALAASTNGEGLKFGSTNLDLFYFKVAKNREKAPYSYNLYVKELPLSFTDDNLKGAFIPFGNIISARVIADKNGSKGIGFVCFEKEEDAKQAEIKMNGISIEDKKLVVAKANVTKSRDPKQKESMKKVYYNCNVFVKNLNAKVGDEDLKKEFASYGKIASARVMLTPEGTSKGYAFVCFENTEAAQKLIQDVMVNKIKYFKGELLYASIAEDKAERYNRLSSEKVMNTWDKYSLPFKMARPGYPPISFYRPNEAKPHPVDVRNMQRAMTVNPIHMQVPMMIPMQAPAMIPIAPPVVNETMEREQMGEALYSKIAAIDMENAPKITGMILEMGKETIVGLLKNNMELVRLVNQAKQMLITSQ